METPPLNVCELSVHLARVLDEIGLNELTVQKRRETFLCAEHVETVFSELFEDTLLYVFESQTEGTTLRGLNSDHDTLLALLQFKIIQDSTEWTEGKNNLLLISESTPTGYCRLQLMKQNRPEPEDTPPNQDYTHNECIRVILKNTALDQSEQYILQSHRNGPAHTFSSMINSDITPAFVCASRLAATEKWAERKRRGNWPPASLIEQVVNASFFLVPVAHKLSPTQSLEWRISTSLSERCLMFSLNIIQIKCYAILKILMKTFVTPLVGKSISSHHCKTALLYSMERHEADFWREDNLIQSVTRCLEMLLGWVTDEFCPHFIIANANLFAGKVTSDNRRILQSVLQKLIKYNVTHLNAVAIDGIGYRLQMKFGTEPTSIATLDTIETNSLLGYLEMRSQNMLNKVVCVEVYQLTLSWNQAKVISAIQQAITRFENQTNDPDTLKQKASKHAIKFLSGLLGCHLASSSLAHYQSITTRRLTC